MQLTRQSFIDAARRHGQRGVERVRIEQSIVGRGGGRGPNAREMRAAIVRRQRGGDGRLRQRHHEVGCAGHGGRRPQHTRGGDAGYVVGQQQRALDRLAPQRVLPAHRCEIGFHRLRDVAIAAFHAHAVDKSLHHGNRKHAVTDALARHIGPHQQIAGVAIGLFDGVGDGLDVRQRNVGADQFCIERTECFRGKHACAGDLDAGEPEADFVNGARNGRMAGRLHAEIEIGSGLRLRQRPVAARLDGTRQRNRRSNRSQPRQRKHEPRCEFAGRSGRTRGCDPAMNQYSISGHRSPKKQQRIRAAVNHNTEKIWLTTLFGIPIFRAFGAGEGWHGPARRRARRCCRPMRTVAVLASARFRLTRFGPPAGAQQGF